MTHGVREPGRTGGQGGRGAWDLTTGDGVGVQEEVKVVLGEHDETLPVPP